MQVEHVSGVFDNWYPVLCYRKQFFIVIEYVIIITGGLWYMINMVGAPSEVTKWNASQLKLYQGGLDGILGKNSSLKEWSGFGKSFPEKWWN